MGQGLTEQDQRLYRGIHVEPYLVFMKLADAPGANDSTKHLWIHNTRAAAGSHRPRHSSLRGTFRQQSIHPSHRSVDCDVKEWNWDDMYLVGVQGLTSRHAHLCGLLLRQVLIVGLGP